MTPKESRELLTTEGFIRYFYKIVRDDPGISQNDAYEKAEDEFKKNFGKRKYSCFDSFRQIKRRYLKKK